MASSFRILDQKPVYRTNTDIAAAGGSLTFFVTGTTTPKVVYGDKAMTVNNGSTVTLDSAGRPNVDVWGDGAYRVTLKDSAGAVQWTLDNVEIQDSGGLAIPALSAAKFLYNDGSTVSWATVLQLPDMTGHSGKQLGTDGTTAFWEAKNTSSVAKHQTVTVTGAATTIDLSLGTSITLNHNLDTSLTFTNPPSASLAYVVTITRIKDASGTARTITNAATLATWTGGALAYTQTTGAHDEWAIKFRPGVTKGDGTYALALA